MVEEFRAAANLDRARQVSAGNEPVNAAHRDVEVPRSGGDGNECRNRTVCCRIHGFFPFAPLNTIEGRFYPESERTAKLIESRVVWLRWKTHPNLYRKSQDTCVMKRYQCYPIP